MQRIMIMTLPGNDAAQDISPMAAPQAMQRITKSSHAELSRSFVKLDMLHQLKSSESCALGEDH